MQLAEVKIWDTLVGALFWDNKKSYAVFEYDPSFESKAWDLSPIRMPVQSNKKTFYFTDLALSDQKEYNTFKGLPGLFADSLPDKYGNQLINQWLAQQGRNEDSLNPVEKLCFIGTRGMGALEYFPALFNSHERSQKLELQNLVTTAQKILTQRKSFKSKLSPSEKDNIQDLIKIGTSAGGARPKAVIAYNEKTNEVRSGQVEAASGFKHWLIKLDGVSNVQLGKSHGFGRVEMAYYNMAKDCGITMMPSRLIEEDGRAHFMTQRFDREDRNIKNHIQTFCAIKHFDYNYITSFSYEQLFQTMRQLKLNYTEVEQMYRRMIFNVLSRNCDDHTKNFSFMLKRDKSWELAPAYDLCFAYDPSHLWVSQQVLSINGKRDNFTFSDFKTIARLCNVKNYVHIIEQIQDVIHQWDKYSNEVEIPKKLKAHIAKYLIKNIKD